MRVCSLTLICCAGHTLELKNISLTLTVHYSSLWILLAFVLEISLLWLIKYTLEEHVFLNAPNTCVSKDALEFPTKVFFSFMFNQHSSNAGLSMIKALGPGDCIRICVWLDCFNNISLRHCSSYYYLHVKLKKTHEKCTDKGNSHFHKVRANLLLDVDILQTCSESVANSRALERDLPKPFCLKFCF